MEPESLLPQQSLRFSFIKNKKFNFTALMALLLILLFLIGAAFTFALLTKKPETKPAPQILINPANLLEITLSFDKSASKVITIKTITEKSTKIPPPPPMQIVKNYTLQVLNDREQVVMQAPFDLPEMSFGDTQLFDKNATESGNRIITKGDHVITLPDIKGSKIRIIDKNRKVIDEKNFTPKPNITSFIQRSRIADSGSPYSIAFLSLGYSSSQMNLYHQHIQLVKSFLLSKTPYKENAGLLTFNTIDSPTVTQADLGCVISASSNRPAPYCDPAKVTSYINDQGQPSRVSVILMYFNGEDRGSATSAVGGPAVVSFMSNDSVGHVVMHELGHAIAGLMDEYVYTDPAYVAGYTIAVKNCFKGTPPNSEWAGLVSNADYKFIGCSNKDWYRSTDNSIMRDNWTAANQFYNPVSLKFMNEAMGFSASGNPGSGGNGACKTLQNGVNRVTESTTFCSGTVQSNQGDSGVVQIGADNITVDGGGVVIDGGNKSGSGITSDSHSGITIKNFTVKNFGKGIVATNGSNVTITNNTVSGNGSGAGGAQFPINADLGSTPGGGILLSNISGGSHITSNTAQNEDVGINLYNSTGNTISDNTVSNNNAWGVRLYASSNNTVSNNTASHVNPCSGPCDSAGILLVKGSNGNTIFKNDITYSGDGFFIGNEAGSPSNNNTITGNDGSYSLHNCFEATFSTGNTFTGNTATHCGWGFWLGYSNATLTGNVITNNSDSGIGWPNGNHFSGGLGASNKPGAITNNQIKNNGNWGIFIKPGESDYPAGNLSSFPANNEFSGNGQGNCTGNGFTDADKKGGKCPDGKNGQTPDPNAGGNVGAQPGSGANPGGGNSSAPSTPPNKDGYCANGNGENANPHWANTARPITCSFGSTHYGNDSSANAYCNSTYKNTAPYFYECYAAEAPGNGGINPIVICKNNGGVDGSKFPNGFVASLCFPKNTAPTDATYTQGFYTSANAAAKKYKDNTFYDSYICHDGKHDFIKFENSTQCSQPPWTPAESSNSNSCPKPGEDQDKTVWDGTQCIYPPDACPLIGPNGKTNMCVPLAQKGNYSAPDINPAFKNAADKVCTRYENETMGNSGPYACVLAPSGGGSNPNPNPNPSPNPSPTPNSGGNPPSSNNGSETEYGHCYHGDQDCAKQYKCNNPSGGAIAYCIYKNPSETDAYCQSGSNHCESGSTCTRGSQDGLHMGDNYSCQKAGLGQICCTGQ